MTNYQPQREWAKRNPEKVREMGNNWSRSNPDKVKAKGLKWREANQEKRKLSKKAWDQSEAGKLGHRRAYEKQRDKCRAFLNELKNKPCLDCHNCFPPECMQFDHVRGKKLGNPGSMFNHAREKLLDEVAKCDLVCANCHAIRTFSRLKGTNKDAKVPSGA